MRQGVFWVGLLTAVGLLSGGCAAPKPFKVMSFNVRYATDADGENSWAHRRDHVVQLIQMRQPDVIGLQEVLASQAAELCEALSDYGFVGVGRDDGRSAGEFVPIFYRRERFTLTAAGHFWLSDTPERPGSVGWDASLPRVATWARLKPRDAIFTEMHVVNVHFDHRGEKARCEAARLVRRTVESLGTRPVMVLGDFNCPPGSEPYRILTEDRGDLAALTDAHSGLGTSAQVGTFHAFTGQPQGGRIDWILANRRFTLRAAEVIRDSRGARFPSDHFPVWAVLELNAVRPGYT